MTQSLRSIYQVIICYTFKFMSIQYGTFLIIAFATFVICCNTHFGQSMSIKR